MYVFPAKCISNIPRLMNAFLTLLLCQEVWNNFALLYLVDYSFLFVFVCVCTNDSGNMGTGI